MFVLLQGVMKSGEAVIDEGREIGYLSVTGDV